MTDRDAVAASPHDLLTMTQAARRCGVPVEVFRQYAKEHGLTYVLPMQTRTADADRVWWGDVERSIRATAGAPRLAAVDDRPRRVAGGGSR